jgi:cysteine desulfurase
VLTAMGLTSGEARASIRFSLGKQTSQEDLAFVLEQLPATVSKLRELSPLWSGSKARQSVGGS